MKGFGAFWPYGAVCFLAACSTGGQEGGKGSEPVFDGEVRLPEGESGADRPREKSVGPVGDRAAKGPFVVVDRNDNILGDHVSNLGNEDRPGYLVFNNIVDLFLPLDSSGQLRSHDDSWRLYAKTDCEGASYLHHGSRPLDHSAGVFGDQVFRWGGVPESWQVKSYEKNAANSSCRPLHAGRITTEANFASLEGRASKGDDGVIYHTVSREDGLWMASCNKNCANAAFWKASRIANAVQGPVSALVHLDGIKYQVVATKEGTGRLRLLTCKNDCEAESSWSRHVLVDKVSDVNAIQLVQRQGKALHILYNTFSDETAKGTLHYGTCKSKCTKVDNWTLTDIGVTITAPGFQSFLDQENMLLFSSSDNQTGWRLAQCTKECGDSANWSTGDRSLEFEEAPRVGSRFGAVFEQSYYAVFLGKYTSKSAVNIFKCKKSTDCLAGSNWTGTALEERPDLLEDYPASGERTLASYDGRLFLASNGVSDVGSVEARLYYCKKDCNDINQWFHHSFPGDLRPRPDGAELLAMGDDGIHWLSTSERFNYAFCPGSCEKNESWAGHYAIPWSVKAAEASKIPRTFAGPLTVKYLERETPPGS